MILRKRMMGLCLALLLAVTALLGAANQTGRDRVAEAAKSRALANYGKLPLSFEENRGQAASNVKYISHGSGYSIGLTPSTVLMNLPAGKQGRQSAVKMSFRGANSAPAMSAAERQSGVSSYFVGNDPARWISAAPNFGRVTYQGLYPGVDLAFYGKQGLLEYDFMVAPGADAKPIAMQFDGVNGLRLDGAGNLILSAATGEIRQHKPVVYQETERGRQTVDARYIIRNGNQVSFEIAAYDRTKTLVIDPALTFSTYFGSPGEETYSISAAASTSNYPAVAVDAQGSVYITGFNGGSSATFTGQPTVLTAPDGGGGTDVFVVKMNGTGTTMLYSVVFGGAFTDVPGGIAVDAVGNAYVTGYTNSTSFPVTPNAPQTTLNGGWNAFVTELNAAGSGIVYSTYLGGGGGFWGRAIAVDHAGNAYVTGTAQASGSPSFPLVNPISSAPAAGFLTEVKAGGSSFVYSTYLSAGIGYGIAVDNSGDAFVTGSSGTAAAPSPAQGYVLKVYPGGAGTSYGPIMLGHSGGTMQTIGFGIALDSQDDAYVTGMTNDGALQQITSGAAQGTYGGGLTDGFALELNPTGGVMWGTYLGGIGSNYLPERGSGIGVDVDGNVYVSGTTQCIAFPTSNGISGARNGGPEVLMKGTITGNSSTWSPTSLSGRFDQVTALAFDSAGNLYAGASAVNAIGGGVYKMPAGSGTWTPATTGITSSTIDSIAVDPNSPSIVYAAGSGHIYQSINGGSSWTQLSQSIGTAATIAIAKTSPSTIYVGSSIGLIYSTTSGAIWTNPSVGPGSGAVNTIIVDPVNTRTAYAGTPSSVYQTVNGGANWSPVNLGLPTGLGGNVTSLAINGATGGIFAATPNGLYFTTNANSGWAQLTLGLEVVSTPLLVAVDSANDVYVAFEGSGAATATNGGATQSDWSPLTYNGLTQNQIEALATPPSGSGTVYAGMVSATTAFLTEIAPGGKSFSASNCIGGTDNNLGQNIAVTHDGAVYVSGLTAATNYPTTAAAPQKTNAGLYDAFLSRVDNVPFTDVPPSNAFFNFINVMYEQGITGGCSTNPPQYCPNSTTTRGEMAVFIITAMFGGQNFTYTQTPYFNDVPASNGFFKFIQKMKDLNITSGCGNGSYCPDDPVTRGEMAVFIIVARYGSTPYTYPTTPYFGDVPSNSAFFPFVQKMAQLGITSGCGNGNYCPDQSLTRGQMAVFIVTGLLDQMLPLTTPVITEAIPNSGSTGQSVTVTLTGIGTTFNSSTQVFVPTGLSVTNMTVLSPNVLSIQLNISSSAVPSLTATNGSLYTIAVVTGSQEADLPNGFTVQ